MLFMHTQMVIQKQEEKARGISVNGDENDSEDDVGANEDEDEYS